MPRDYTRLDPVERLLRHVVVDDDTGCWLWTAKTWKGYGVTTLGFKADGNQRRVLAHRAMYELFVGPIPEGLDLDHLCRNPPCVNPEHLEAVTRRENLLRGIGIPAQKAAQTHCIHGHEFTPENTYVPPSGGQRRCRMCRRKRGRAADARRAHTSRCRCGRPKARQSKQCYICHLAVLNSH